MSDIDGIRQTAKDYAQAFQQGDLDRMATILTEDFIAMPPDQPAFRGRDCVLEQIRNDLKTMTIVSLNFEVEEVETSSNLACAIGRSRAELIMTEDPDTPVEMNGKFLWILRKTDDGRWLLARDSCSGNGPGSE
ncbi:RNA polymerase factor sigma-70 [Thalassoglobus neptunius]|uniref:RNA polymerase factor sigma-70 n=1 Tax=Thalassoglobus neptunius TaxID=1938619 RepID=A0A5C5WY22_9PLAN|nr:DUF4440 domain-containing protein [Thalassoglobus neptunius]TWT55480.1 RNA polymerase factor sigma-70 [Thalassoglobus neptunius]